MSVVPDSTFGGLQVATPADALGQYDFVVWSVQLSLTLRHVAVSGC